MTGVKMCKQRRASPTHYPRESEQEVLDTLSSEAERDMGPQQVVVRLADEGRYIASESSMYRILRKKKQLTHRSRRIVAAAVHETESAEAPV